MSRRGPSPTTRQYSAFQHAYAVFNSELFGNALPDCLITLQRKANCHGYFSFKRFTSPDGKATTDEIAINPQFLASHGVMEGLQTLVHEMVHLWQYHHGNPGRARYHNAEWADKMEAIGLMPSSTGEPGGKRTGERIADYPIPGGKFEKVAEILLATAFQIPWVDRHIPGTALPGSGNQAAGGEATGDGFASLPKPPRSKVKFTHTCPDSTISNLWGKPGLAVACVHCGGLYEPTEEV